MSLLRPIKDTHEAGFFIVVAAVYGGLAALSAVSGHWIAVWFFVFMVVLSLGRLIEYTVDRRRRKVD